MNLRIVLAIAAICVPSTPPRIECAELRSVPLNIDAFNFARELISRGHVVADKQGAWRHHRSARGQENRFIRDHGFGEYAKWHLGIDERYGLKRKARYKFPFGDFQNLHRCGLLAVKARAHEFCYPEIENAAAALLEMIESARPRAQKRVD